MPLGNIFSNIFSSGAKDVLDSVGSIVDSVVTTKEEKEALKIELQKEINRSMEAMQDKALTEMELSVRDLESARAREVELAKAGAKDKTPSVLAYLAVIGFIAMILFLLIFGFGSLTVDQALLVGSLLGVLGSNSTTVYNYYFGSSAGSKEKAKSLDTLVDRVSNKENGNQ